MKRIIYVTLILIIFYLFLKRSDVYAGIIDGGVKFFRAAWLALTKGEA